MTWSQAEVYAQRWAGHLVTISDQAGAGWLDGERRGFFAVDRLYGQARKGLGRGLANNGGVHDWASANRTAGRLVGGRGGIMD